MQTLIPEPNPDDTCLRCHAPFDFHMKNPSGVKYVTMRPLHPEFIMEDSAMPVLEEPLMDVHMCTSFKQAIF